MVGSVEKDLNPDDMAKKILESVKTQSDQNALDSMQVYLSYQQVGFTPQQAMAVVLKRVDAITKTVVEYTLNTRKK